MEKLLGKIGASIDAFKTDAELQIEKANKAAGMRARKVSLELEKHLKEFRKKSMDSTK